VARRRCEAAVIVDPPANPLQVPARSSIHVGVRTNEERWIVVGRSLLVLTAGAWLAWAVSALTTSGDYASRAPVGGDNAGPILLALAHGHVSQAASLQPLMGLASIVWRLPFVVLADLLGGSEHLVYALGALACLAPAVGLVAWLARRAERFSQLAYAALAAAAIVAGPATSQAIRLGHPEEMLATVLAILAVMTAAKGRHGWAAVLLGLAIATKQWALVAAPCVLLALPDRRFAVAARAAVVAGVAAIALPLADPGAFTHAETVVGGGRVDGLYSLWSSVGLLFGKSAISALPAGLTRSQASPVALLLALAVVWVYARRQAPRRSHAIDMLPLLALFGLLRCVCDPNPWSYYFVPLIIPLAIWEAGTLKRLPLVTGLCCAGLSLGPSGALTYLAGDGILASPVVGFIWLGAVAVLACYLASCAVGPDRVPLTLRVRPPQPARAG
jgi:hypothetical protein